MQDLDKHALSIVVCVVCGTAQPPAVLGVEQPNSIDNIDIFDYL